MERLSLLFSIYTIGLSTYSIGKFILFLFNGTEAVPSVVFTENWKYRLLIDFGLAMQFIVLHVAAKAPIFQDIFARGNFFTNSFGTFYALLSSFSLYLIPALWHPVHIYLWNFSHLLPLHRTLFPACVALLGLVLLAYSPGVLVGFTPVYERREYRLPESLKRLTNMKHPTLLAFCLLFFGTHTLTLDRALLGYLMMAFTYLSSNITNDDAEYIMQSNYEFIETLKEKCEYQNILASD